MQQTAAIPLGPELDKRCMSGERRDVTVYHKPDAFLDKYSPGWRKYVHLWPPRAGGKPRNDGEPKIV
ncbi:MAG: hypothetical protein QME74_10415 [Candidatus Edwardsbacteria bacterium]|nr:hypothetical protein [Candidatus Edwardsbacteria bacterium]